MLRSNAQKLLIRAHLKLGLRFTFFLSQLLVDGLLHQRTLLFFNLLLPLQLGFIVKRSGYGRGFSLVFAI